MARRQQGERPQYLNHIRCPECGVAMAERTRTRFNEDGESPGAKFYGCRRFPLCVGTRPFGVGIDSYTKLLQAAYTKALVFLSSPKFLGVEAAQPWLLAQALEKGDDYEVLVPAVGDYNPNDLDNGALEHGIDAACDYAAEHGIEQDFLVLAHEERMLAIRSRLKYSTKPEVMRGMPRAEIQRRYDTGTMEQFEASITTDWTNDGQHCPRCGGWAQAQEAKHPMVNGEVDWDALFKDMDANGEQSAWTCATCGPFSRIGDTYTYDNDALDPMSVKGATFINRRRP